MYEIMKEQNLLIKKKNKLEKILVKNSRDDKEIQARKKVVHRKTTKIKYGLVINNHISPFI